MSTLTLDEVEVRYGALLAIAPLSLEVQGGRVLAVTGPSGAGKTSLLWLMAGALEPDRGRVALDGVPVGRRPEAAARGIAVVPQGNGLAAVLTADLLGARLVGIEDSGELPPGEIGKNAGVIAADVPGADDADPGRADARLVFSVSHGGARLSVLALAGQAKA